MRAIVILCKGLKFEVEYFKFMWVKMKSRKSKKNKKITLALAAGVALTSFSTLSAKADEQVDVKSTGNTVAEEKHVQTSPTTAITQVEGVEVSNGTALVSKTPTKEVVGQAKGIKEQADQAVETQIPVVEDAKKQEATTSEKESNAKQALEEAEQKKNAATPEAIEGTKNAIDASKKEVTTQTEKIDSLKEQQNQVQEKKNAQEAVVKDATEATNKQAGKVTDAKKKVQNAQNVLNGTGADKVVKEEKDAKKDLEAKQVIVKGAKKALEQAQDADATKARKLSGAKELEAGQKNTFDQATDTLSKVTQAHNEATSQLKVAKQNKDNAQAVLDGTGTKAILNERDSAKSDLATKEATLGDATKKLADAKKADAKKAEQFDLLNEAKTQAEAEESKTANAQTKAQGGARQASTKLTEATKAEKEAKDSLASSENRLSGVTSERDDAKADLATKQSKKDDAERKLEDAKNTDAKKRSDIQDLKTLKGQQESTIRSTSQELSDATSAAKNAEDAKKQVDKAVDTLEKQISAIKNLTIPQLPQNVIAAYKTYLNDDSEANKHALNNAIQAWYKDGKYDFGTRQFGWSSDGQELVFKGWTNKNIVLPIDDTVVNLDNPTDEQIKALSHYYVLLANNLQDQVWGTHNFIVTKESVQGIKNIAKNYANENKPYNTGHSHPALENDGVDSVSWDGEVLNYTNTLSSTSPYEKAIDTEKTHKATMSQLYREVYDAVIAFMTNDIHANFGHMKGIVGRVKPTYPSAVGGNVSYTKDNTGRIHFVKFAGENAHTETTINYVTGERTSVYIDDYYDKGIAKPLPTPFDTSKIEKDLAQAKKTQVSAVATNNNAQNRLASAKRADETAKSNLATTTNRLNNLLNTQDLTPNAQRVLDNAKSELSKAELRNTNASTAFTNLTKEIKAKRATHEQAKDALSKATIANTVAQKTLADATTAHNNAVDKLNSIKDAIKRTKAIKDLTTDAQAKFDTAKAEHQTAKTRYEKAEKALVDLNNEINTNSNKLAQAKSELSQAEKDDKTAKSNLAKAVSAKNNASKSLEQAKDALAKVKAIKDLTPEAQATFDQAELAYKTAKTRLENAETAVTNLNADLAVKRQALAVAVKALKDAESLTKKTQAELKVAQATYKKANDELTATRKVIAELEATKDLTPDAQKAYQEALEAEVLAEKHLSDAKTAVDNLTADVKTKQEALEQAKAKLAQEELVLEGFKAKQAQEEKVLATIQAQLDDLKAQEKTVRAEIAKIEDSIKEMEGLLDSLIHASENYEVAKEEYEKALEAHRLALQTLEAEQAKLNALLQNQLDAKAQYEAVLVAYQKAYNKPQESLNHRHDSKVENIEHKLVTDKLRTALSNPAYIYVGNKPKYGVNTTLPNTGSENSLFLIGLGAMFMGLFGIKLRRKSE